MENNNKRIVKNTIYLTAQMVAGLFVSLYNSRIILQTLGVNDFGTYSVVAGFVSMFAFLNGTLVTGAQRFYNYEIGKNGVIAAREVYNVSFRIQIIMVVIVVAVAETIGLWYLNHKMVIAPDRLYAARQVFHFSVLSMTFVILQVPFGAAIMAHERMGYYSVIQMTDIVLKLAIALSLPYLGGDKLVVYGMLLLGISILNFLLYSIYSYKKFEEIKLVRKFSKRLFKEMLSFSGWNAFGAFANVANGQGINVILNLFMGTVVNAARGVAFQVKGAIQGFVSTITVAVKPQLTQSYSQGNIIRTFSLMFSMSKISSLILYALSLPLLLEISIVLRLWLGDFVPQYTGTFTILIVLTSMVDNLNSPVSFVVHATGKMSKYQIICSMVTLLALPLSYMALKIGQNPVVVFGIVLFVAIIKQVVALFILRTLTAFSIKKYIKSVIMPLSYFMVASCFIPLIPHFLMQESILRLFVVVVVSEVAILPSAYFLLLNNEEKQVLMEYVAKYIPKLKK